MCPIYIILEQPSYMYGAIQKLQMQNKLLYLNDLNCMQNNIQSIVHPENVEYPS